MVRYNSIDEIPPHIKNVLNRYFSNVGGDTFVITGLPHELTGGALARYSRAQTGMQLTTINEFLDEHGEPSQQRGTELMNRVLNAFGDDSVGELEGAHVGLENVSQLLTKLIEWPRIGGSPIEQSTRYVKYDQKDKDGKWRYLRPQEVIEAGRLTQFERVNDRAFELYSQAIAKLYEHFEREYPKDKHTIEVVKGTEKIKIGESELRSDEERKAFETSYKFTVRCAALDVGRCILPASTLTHLGVFGNGRYFTGLLNAMKSDELLEARERAGKLEAELNKTIPTFVKRNRENPQLAKINEKMRTFASTLFKDITPSDDSVTLVPRHSDLDEIVASALFPYTNISLSQILEKVSKLPESKKLEINKIYMGERNTRRDRTGRGTEAGYPITFDLVGGFAEYRDLQRHRMLTQQRQLIGTGLGFIMPEEIRIIGLETPVLELVDMMNELNRDIRKEENLHASQYATLFNHRMRFMMGMNLREFQHLAELRTQPAGHHSYRAMTMEMTKKLIQRDPWTKEFLGFVDFSDPNNKIARAKEQSKIAGKNLAKGVSSEGDLD